MCFYMETLPKVSTYSLEPGRQSCCILEYPKHPFYSGGAFILQRRDFHPFRPKCAAHPRDFVVLAWRDLI
jgi:hypothetical protein